MQNTYQTKDEYLKYIKSSQNSTSKKAKSLFRRQGKEMKRHFTEEDTQMANTHKKRCSKSLSIRDRQIKTT